MTSIRPSTVVRRTDAGNAELATPAHGLSLAQRRFLTLLGTAASVATLAERHHVESSRLTRDVERLATLGLVACEEPPANDATAIGAAANDPAVTRAAVRLGARLSMTRAVSFGAALLAATLAWTAWRYLPTPAPAERSAPIGETKTALPSPARETTAIDPQPIATRVLRGDMADRTRDAGKDARARPAAPPPGAAPLPSSPAVSQQVPTPVGALDTSLARTPMRAAALDVAPALLAMPVPSGTPAPALLPMPDAPPPRIEPAPVHGASAAPPGAQVHRVAAAALVPTVRDMPPFPREALAAGVDGGSVKARLTIGADGNVEDVEIVSASHRSFQRAVRDALARWRFEPGAAGRRTDVDVAFKRD